MDKFHRNMLGIAGTAAVAHDPQPPPSSEPLGHLLTQLTNLPRVTFEELVLDFDRFLALAHHLVMPLIGRDGSSDAGNRAHATPPTGTGVSLFCLSRCRP